MPKPRGKGGKREAYRRYRATPNGKKLKKQNRVKRGKMLIAQRLLDPDSALFRKAVRRYERAVNRRDKRGADKWRAEISRLAKLTPRFVCSWCNCQDEHIRLECVCGCHGTLRCLP